MLIQASDVDIQAVTDGYIVYQSSSDRVHYLNRTAALLFELCDGKRDADDIVAIAAETFGLGSSAQGEVRDGLDSMVKAGLLVEQA